MLPLPTPRRATALEQLREYASVQLFVDRARAARAGFQLTEANAAAVGELCDRLEGLPLALELAAARAGVLAPQQMLAQLEQRFAFLVSRQRDAPLRHRTLRAAVESSYQLLDPELRQFFARLSVFRGGWTLEAAQAVGDSPGALDALEQLRDCSLIVVEEAEAAVVPRAGSPGTEEVRYRLLETLREYGWEQLAASGELAAVRKRHRDWFLQLAEQADAAAFRPEQQVWLVRLEAELENLRAALAWCQEAGEERIDRESGQRRGPGPGDAHPDSECAVSECAYAPPPAAETGLRLASALFYLWYARGYLQEGLEWLEGAMARGDRLSAAVRAAAYYRGAHLASSLGQVEKTRSFLHLARREQECVLARARAEGDRREIAQAVLVLSQIAQGMNDLNAAWTYGAEARERLMELDDMIGVVRALEVMGDIAQWRGERLAGRPLLEERLAICRKLSDPHLLIHALGAMGHLIRDEGDYDKARSLYFESLTLRQQCGYWLALAQSLEDLAALARREQQIERAIRLLGAADAYCETLGARPPVAVAAEYQRTVAEGQTALGEAAFAAAWAEGRAMSLQQAIEDALGRF